MRQIPTIRPERPTDLLAIAAVTRAAFRGHPHSQQTEAFIISALRRAGALVVSLVADLEGVVGHIAFSPVVIGDGSSGWYGLGPVSVRPDLQGRGIGRSLIGAGLEALSALGSRGCVLVGEPTFYARFGFRNHPGLSLEGVPPEYFLALPLATGLPQGAVTFHEGFRATT